jgi:hypothetical protein
MAATKKKRAGPVRRSRGAEVAGPPGAPQHVLVDQMPYGRLVVGRHNWDKTQATEGAGKFAIDGEAVAVAFEAAPGTARRSERRSGTRSFVCVWEPGPGFKANDAVRVVVSAAVSVTQSVRLQGSAASNATALGKTKLVCDILGQRESFAASVKLTHDKTGAVLEVRDSRGRASLEPLGRGSIGSHQSAAHRFVARDGDELRAGKLTSKPFAASSVVESEVRTGPGLSIASDAAVSAQWSVSITIGAIEEDR